MSDCVTSQRLSFVKINFPVLDRIVGGSCQQLTLKYVLETIKIHRECIIRYVRFFFKQMFVIEEQGLRLFLNKKENNHVLITYHFIYVYILLQLLIS